jgi:hypothetical protein
MAGPSTWWKKAWGRSRRFFSKPSSTVPIQLDVLNHVIVTSQQQTLPRRRSAAWPYSVLPNADVRSPCSFERPPAVARNSITACIRRQLGVRLRPTSLRRPPLRRRPPGRPGRTPEWRRSSHRTVRTTRLRTGHLHRGSSRYSLRKPPASC